MPCRKRVNLYGACRYLIDGNFCNKPENFNCEDKLELKKHLSQSQVADWLRCRRRYYIKHILRIVLKNSKTSNAIKMGSLWDVSMNRLRGDLSEHPKDVIFNYEIDPFDVARVKALYKAYKEFVKIDEHQYREIQKERTELFGDVKVNGIIDEYLGDGYIERKLSFNPQNYFNRFYIYPQLATYFNLFPECKWVVIEPTQRPQQKPKKATKNSPEETVEQFQDRVYGEILSRPSQYFPHLDRTKGTFGMRFYQSDFDLNEIKQRYMQIRQEIESLFIPEDKDIMLRHFYKCEPGCYAYGDWCEYQEICNKPNDCNISESLYCDEDIKNSKEK